MIPERCDTVDESVALALAGPTSEVFCAEGAKGCTGTAGTVVIADFVDTPYQSGLWGKRRFVVHAPIWAVEPPRPGSRLVEWLSPGDPRPVHLFVRMAEGCLYLGTGELSEAAFEADLSFGRGSFDIERVDHELASKVYGPVDRPRSSIPEWVDLLPADPLAALEGFIVGWYPETDTAPTDPVDYSGVPAPLAQFYRLAETRPRIFGWHSTIRPLSAWRERKPDGRWCLGGGWDSFAWFIEPEEPDPTVWTEWEGTETLAPEREPLTGFLIQFALSEAIIGAQHELRAAKLPEERFRQIVGELCPVPLRPARWPDDPTHYYVGEDLLAWGALQADGTWWIHAGAKHPGALRPLQARPVSDAVSPTGAAARPS